ncbi:MAG: hypothetical protein CBC83_06695 [Flavobacteriales bacterium TMED123]|nr:MAG: hypothetical protein CBC83_06695 [Flavobacteriales bacterium TMED123]|tara:strand:- start:2577 stop:4832 length:2256 start_codon:yes stop_codon:yes gene_type:complete
MKKLLSISLLLLLSTIIFAQSGTIRGFVYDKESAEPIIFCNVSLAETTLGAPTDVNGFFSIANVPAGHYKIIITYLGYDSLHANIHLSAGKILTKKFELSESSIKLDEVKVSAERQEMKTEVKAAVIKITPKDLEMIPAIGGEPDLAQYLQIVPGVVFTGDQGGQLYIRGGSPVQNKVLLDGMIVYSPFHSIGLFSVFDTDIIRNTDVYTGGFNAEYGGRISSIMDIKTRDGNKKNFEGKLSANTFGSKLLLEGPLSKKGKSSFVFSGKTSYLNKSSELFYKHPILYFDEKGLPYSYTDLYGKFSFHGDNGSKLNVFGFNFSDRVNYQYISDLEWDSKGVGSQFILVPGSSPILIEGNFAFSNYGISMKEAASPLRSSEIIGFNLGFDFTYFLSKGKIKYGFDVLGFETDFSTFNSVNSIIEQDENTSEFSAYVNYQYTSTRFIIEPGFRIQKYTLGFSPEPRLGMKYNLTDKLRLKFATGIYSQNILSTVSDRDVVNLFYGFISGPEDIPLQTNGEEYPHKLQKATHFISGIEYDLSNNMDLSIEGYRKNFTQQTNINRNKTSNSDDDFIIETGYAQGLDVLLKYSNKQLYLWGVYSLGFVRRDDGIKEYAPHFDRRHNVNFVASFKFGRNNSWKTDLRWNLGSGFPFTQTQGFYESLTFEDGINTDYTSVNGDLGIQYAELNKGRLPYYHRLDLSISKIVKVANKSDLEISASVTNVYNRENIFYFNRIKYERVNQLPIMPSIGASITF